MLASRHVGEKVATRGEGEKEREREGRCKRKLGEEGTLQCRLGEEKKSFDID